MSSPITTISKLVLLAGTVPLEFSDQAMSEEGSGEVQRSIKNKTKTSPPRHCLDMECLGEVFCGKLQKYTL